MAPYSMSDQVQQVQQHQETNSKKSVVALTWMDVAELSRYTTETGKIISRKHTRLTAKEQRIVTRLIKRARNMLLMK
ncbi:MAG: ribosomal protein S18 [Puniceicoccales bacterium]|jgi:ribosomal protein S18|nr:ribosomal protein S18 [Puniceicoccales bacterium]